MTVEMMTKPKPRMTKNRRVVLALMKELGPVSPAGISERSEMSTQDAWHVLTKGAKVGLWVECPGAPLTFQLPTD